MSRIRRMPAVSLLLTAITAVTLLTACSAPNGNAPSSADNGGAADGNNSATNGATGPDASNYALPEKKVVYTGSLSLTTPDLDTAADAAVAAAVAAGGFVGGDKRTSGKDRKTAAIMLRIPSETYVSTVDAIAALGEETSRDVTVEDAAQRIADLDSQIESQRASVERVRALMNDAKAISDVVSLEAELTKRETALAELLAAKRSLDDKVAYSTLTVNLAGPAPEPAAKAEPEGPPGFAAGLAAGWRSFLVFVSGLATVLGAVLPFAVALGVPGLGAWILVRRRRGHPVWRRRRRPPRPGATPPKAPNPYVSG